MTKEERIEQFERFADRYAKSLGKYGYMDFDVWSEAVLHDRIKRFMQWHVTLTVLEAQTGRNPYLTDDGPLFDWKNNV